MNVGYLCGLILVGYKLEKISYLIYFTKSIIWLPRFFLTTLKHFINRKFLPTESLEWKEYPYIWHHVSK